MKPLVFNNTVLRDGQQSLAATRMRTAQMLPVVPLLDGMGFGMLETWGGAVVDSCLRYLGENPFDRVRALAASLRHTPQGMLLRGQNLVQYRNFPDDVVRAFVAASAKAGIQVFRIFDALNDTRNLRVAIEAVRAAGAHARGEICYTTSPAHHLGHFAATAWELKELGCHSIGIKDMAGILAPRAAHELVADIKKRTGLPVVVHSHDTAGLAACSYMAAADAGADAIETSIAPLANGSAQPDTLRMLALLHGHPRRPRLDTAALAELRAHFAVVYQELKDFTSHANEVVDTDTLVYQVPGGMLSNFRVQLRELGMGAREAEVLAEIPRVREALGWPPLVTPISQIVGTQAMLNVKFGPWKNFSPQAMDIALGAYGRTPGPVAKEVRALAEKLAKREAITTRPADLLEPAMPKLESELRAKGLPADAESCVLFAMFPREWEALHRGQPPVAASPALQSPATKGTRLAFTVNGRRCMALIEDLSP